VFVMAEKLFEVRYKGAPKGSQVVQVDGKGKVLKTFSVEDCENALRSPIV
jgi:hypothetical protein